MCTVIDFKTREQIVFPVTDIGHCANCGQSVTWNEEVFEWVHDETGHYKCTTFQPSLVV